jgi:hypothetical protein
MAERLAPLDVVADLSLAVDGHDVHIRADGATIIVEAENLRAMRRLLTSLPADRRNPQRLGRLHGALQTADLTVEVRAGGEMIARMGADADAGAMSRLLRLDYVEVRAARPALSAARRNPGLTAALVAGGVAGGAALLYLLFGRRS